MIRNAHRLHRLALIRELAPAAHFANARGAERQQAQATGNRLWKSA